MQTSRSQYHHGDLKAELIAAATVLVEADGGDVSLREAARQAGVSAAAPYRHFTDKDDLLAAVATRGYHELRDQLVRAEGSGGEQGVLERLAEAYVDFAMHNSGVFRLMFGHPCTKSRPETSAAAAEAGAVFARHVPAGRPPALFVAGGWALAHGIATLLVDGKFPPPPDVGAYVRSVVAEVFALKG